MYEILEQLLKERGITAYRLAQETGVTTATLTGWKQGKYTPKQDKLQKIADYFGVTIDYLMGNVKEEVLDPKPYYALNEKDGRDIARDLERMIAGLESDEELTFNGEPMDDETKRLFAISLENSMRLAKEIAKKKFTPNKYRD